MLVRAAVTLMLPRISECVDEVIRIDGHSTDNKMQVAQNVRPDMLIMMDADRAEIPTFVCALLVGADYAKRSRSTQGAQAIDMPMHCKVNKTE
jgi:hypothetical protein